MERPTVEVYEQRAGDWQVKRPPANREDAVALSRRALAHAPLLDAGSGPGSYLPDLRRPTVALDAAFAMVALARDTAPEVPAVVGDLEALPFRRGAFGGAWGRASYLHIRKTRLPMALARLHDALVVGAPIHLTLREGEGEGPLDNDDFAGRFFARWQAAELAGVATGAGFEIDAVVTEGQWVRLDATRARTLPDFVGPGMRVLTCGLNPSLVAADAGYGYAGPSNRFWKAMTAAGLITRGRDPWHALAVDRVGMTCMVKRATPRSRDLGKDEYRAGAARVAQL
ncbi:MAG: double-stranded uracil-DNA glycosylase, partial [Acidimicrobiaceae bacterium]|nr:double-stranded uracil-DNA glycosylase [Acidimicrobiaceae bacterium]